MPSFESIAKLVGICGPIVGLVSFLYSRHVSRRLRVLVHMAGFLVGSSFERDSYFITVPLDNQLQPRSQPT
jgi:hypothetical protein